MVRLLGVAAWLCATVGIALLMFSIVLVPNHVVLGDDGDPEGDPEPFIDCLSCYIGCEDYGGRLMPCVPAGVFCHCCCVKGLYGVWVCEFYFSNCP